MSQFLGKALPSLDSRYAATSGGPGPTAAPPGSPAAIRPPPAAPLKMKGKAGSLVPFLGAHIFRIL